MHRDTRADRLRCSPVQRDAARAVDSRGKAYAVDIKAPAGASIEAAVATASTAPPVAAAIAADQKTGWTKAGMIRVSSKKPKFGAKTEAIFAMKNTSRTKQRLNFLFTFENSKVIHGPRSAITKAKPLKSHPARSIVMPKASDTCGRIPITPSSVVIRANAPSART